MQRIGNSAIISYRQPDGRTGAARIARTVRTVRAVRTAGLFGRRGLPWLSGGQMGVRMFQINNRKRKIISAVIIILVILAMILPMVASVLG